MALERKNILNKAKSRTKAFSANAADNDNVARIQKDISDNGPALYGVENFYVHNNNRNFLFAAEKVNGILASAFANIKAAWLQESEALKKLSLQKQSEFLKKLESAGIKSKYDLQYMLQQQLGTYQVNISDAISKINALPKGKKTAGQLQTIASQVAQINNTLQTLNISAINNSLVTNIQEANTQAQKFIDWCIKNNIDKDSTDFGVTGAELTKGLSVTKLMFYTLPSTLESLIVRALKDIVPSHLKQEIVYTGGNTAKGSSADLTAFNMGISIKMNKNVVKQAKTRLADSFFELNNNLNTATNMGLGIVQQYLSSEIDKNYTLINVLKYLFVNYASLRTLEATDILNQAWEIVILSNLNEKLFGYGKIGQKGMSLEDIIKQMPVAEINSNGEVIWFSDIINDLMDQIGRNTFNIHSLASYKLNSAFYNNKALLKAKKDAIKQMSEVNYKNIMQAIPAELQAARQELLKSVQLSVQYHINLSNVLNNIK